MKLSQRQLELIENSSSAPDVARPRRRPLDAVDRQRVGFHGHVYPGTPAQRALNDLGQRAPLFLPTGLLDWISRSEQFKKRTRSKARASAFTRELTAPNDSNEVVYLGTPYT